MGEGQKAPTGGLSGGGGYTASFRHAMIIDYWLHTMYNPISPHTYPICSASNKSQSSSAPMAQTVIHHISVQFQVIQQHEVSVEMRFLRGGELKHTHAHKCKVTAGKTLGAVAEKFKDCLVGQGAELVQNSLRVQCSKSDSFVEACGSDIADDVARLEITFEVHADADNCERFFAMLKKQPATSPLPQVSK